MSKILIIDDEPRFCESLKHLLRSHDYKIFTATSAQEALALLETGLREVVVLRIWADMTFNEVSEITGQSASTVFRQFQAGLTAIRKAMGSPCKEETN